MITQLRAIVGFKETELETVEEIVVPAQKEKTTEVSQDVLKTRMEDLSLPARTLKVLDNAGIRTLGGLTKKKEEDLRDMEGLGEKSIQEIKSLLIEYGLTLKK